MNDHFDLLCQAKAAQKRAEQAGFPNTAAALTRIADMIAGMMVQEANMDRGAILPSAPSATPFAGGRQVRH